jgi:hypothetical protein
MTRLAWFGALVASCALVGCDDPPKKNPFDPPPDQAKQPPPITETPKPKGPPELSLDSLGPKVGFTRVLLEQQEGRGKLKAELEQNRDYFAGKGAPLLVDRVAKLPYVAAFLAELGALGSKPVTIKTESRKDFPTEVNFVPENAIGEVPSCSVVAMVTEDRGTAVWKLSGGAAGKRQKGMAGPDLTMTGETIERLAKACSQSRVLFVAAAEGLDWGFVYDLAASTKTYEKAYFDSVVFLGTTPVPGHKVELKR